MAARPRPPKARGNTVLAVAGIAATIGAAWWLYKRPSTGTGNTAASPAIVSDGAGGGSGGVYAGSSTAGTNLVAAVPAPASPAAPGNIGGNSVAWQNGIPIGDTHGYITPGPATSPGTIHLPTPTGGGLSK